ncbi:uncharacterized protein FMAN_15020 [Fusarium mangiferae]|uniref:Nephrocystin 3-like N-terminal domain-containing protein n=1 Tax=Fusarium mangiferae TaxID=192010 RepID=A0A1L7U7P6_FUSMA|nr:uncharacterized protein FMAN_15020 [Fusarium mangiferae]CVL03747.1 uncharacterized protein FMAN_15020 [Fusarium mangiferae]
MHNFNRPETAILKRQHRPSDPTYNGSYARDPTNSAKRELDLEKHVEYLQTLKIQLKHDYMATWKSIRTIGSTSLFLFEPSYDRFIDCSSSSTLLYSGNAGAGKSVILANMVDNVDRRQLENAQIVFFFYLQDEVNSLQALVILGAIYHQVLKRLVLTSRASHVSKGLGVLSTILDITVDIASDLRIALEAAGMTYLVLDGLNKCQESERTKVIGVLQCLQTQCSLSICLSTRPGVLTGIGWTNLHSIDIPTDNPDVSSYIDSETSRLLNHGELTIADPTLELQIRSALTTAAKGNFVRAKRSIELLCAHKTDSDIVRLLADFREDFNDIDTEAMQSKSPTSPAPIAPSGFTDSAYASASLMDHINKNTNDGPAVDQSLQGLDHPTIDDSATEYSDVSSTTFSRKQLYIQELAKDLYNKMSFQAVDSGQDHRVSISATLPRLLKVFALKIGYCATTQMHQDVMAFVHRHRSGITEAFLDIYLSQREMEPQEIACPTPVEVEPMDVIYPSQAEVELREIQGQPHGMSPNEVMALWEQSEDREQTLIVEGLDNLELLETEEEDEYEEADIWVAAYRDFAPGTEAYSWLMTQLQRNMNSVLEEPTAIQLIRDQVLSSVPSPQKISRSVSSESCSVLFNLDWDILEFFDSQEYFGRGTYSSDYSDWISFRCTSFKLCRLPDNTRLGVWINGSNVMVQANGSAARDWRAACLAESCFEKFATSKRTGLLHSLYQIHESESGNATSCGLCNRFRARAALGTTR